MSEFDIVAALGINGIGFGFLYVVVDRGIKAFNTQQQHDRQVIGELVSALKDICMRCHGDK